jgi:hypothetical protein
MIEYLYNSLYGTWMELNEREVQWKFDAPAGPYQKGIYTMHKKERTLGKGTFLLSKVDRQLHVILKDVYAYSLFISPDGKEMTWTNPEENRRFVLQ